MRSLFVAMTLAAAAMVLGPYADGVIEELLVGYVATIALGTLAFYSQGWRRTFFLGAFAAAVLTHLRGAPPSVLKLMGLAWVPLLEGMATLLLYAACGYLAVATRRFLEGRAWHLPDDMP